jgi:hypothetical protein
MQFRRLRLKFSFNVALPELNIELVIIEVVLEVNLLVLNRKSIELLQHAFKVFLVFHLLHQLPLLIKRLVDQFSVVIALALVFTLPAT